MRRLLFYIERAVLVIASLGLLAMMLHVSFDVILKYLFKRPLPLTMEMTTYYYMVAVAFLPLFSLERKGTSLVHVELAYALMARRVRRVVLPAALIAAAIYCACAAYAAWKPAVDAMRTGTYAGSLYIVSIWPTRFLPVVGFALLALTLLIKAFLTIVHDLQDEESQDSPDSVSLEGKE